MDLREYAHHIESELDIVGQDHEDDCKQLWRGVKEATDPCRSHTETLKIG